MKKNDRKSLGTNCLEDVWSLYPFICDIYDSKDNREHEFKNRMKKYIMQTHTHSIENILSLDKTGEKYIDNEYRKTLTKKEYKLEYNKELKKYQEMSDAELFDEFYENCVKHGQLFYKRILNGIISLSE